MHAHRRERFTLLELVVVIGILALTAGISVATIRPESPASRVANAALHFEEFCTRIRFFAQEDGKEKIVLFDPAGMTFSLKQDDDEEENEITPGRMKLSWKIPEGFELDEMEELNADEDGMIEIFRFFPDGSASGHRSFELRYGKLKQTFEISPLTGRFRKSETEEITSE